MSRPNILLDEEANGDGDRHRQLVGVREKGDATETPVPHGERRPDVPESSTQGGGETQSVGPPTGVRAPRALDLVPPRPFRSASCRGATASLPLSSDEATGGLDQHPHAIHERDEMTAVEDGRVAESARKLGSLDAFAPPDTFIVEARYLLTKSGCFSKMEVPNWWRSGMLLSLLGYCLFCDGNPWGSFFLRAGADILFANWNARSEVRRVGAHEPSVGVTPALTPESQRVGAPPPTVEASRAQWKPSRATNASCIEPLASARAVEASCIDECTSVLAVEAPRVDPGHDIVFMPPSVRTRRGRVFRARYVSHRLRRARVGARWASVPITNDQGTLLNEFVEAVVARLKAEGLTPSRPASASNETAAPATRRGTRSRAAVLPPSPALASNKTATPAIPSSNPGNAQAPKIAPSDWYDQDSAPIARRTYLELCRKDRIESTKVGKKVLVKRDVFDAWIAAQRKSPPLAAAPPSPTPPAPTNEELLRGAGVLVPPTAHRKVRSSSDPPKDPKPRAGRRLK